MRVDVITILPEYVAPLRLSLLGRAIANGTVDLQVHDLREATTDRHRTVDDTPFGGGAGMVMTPEPWALTLEAVLNSQPHRDSEVRPRLLIPSPAGRVLDQAFAQELAAEPWLVLGCGRYEGIDERVLDWAADDFEVTPVSLGDYVLFGGEVAALVVLEAVIRLLPGVLGNPDSLAEESHTDGLLEYPLYTKPASWRGRDVPGVLLSGNHAAIAQWRHDQREQRTAERRPDLLTQASVTSVQSLLGTQTGAPAAGDVEVRAAVPADAAEVLVLQRACWLEEAQANPGVQIPALTESLADVRAGLTTPHTTTWVVRSQGRLIASGRGQLSPDGATWHVGRLMVAPDLRGRGLGRWLLSTVEESAPSGVRSYELFTGENSASNLRMYRKAGYRRAHAPAPAGVVVLRKRA